jgi:hypothetical protein
MESESSRGSGQQGVSARLRAVHDMRALPFEVHLVFRRCQKGSPRDELAARGPEPEVGADHVVDVIDEASGTDCAGPAERALFSRLKDQPDRAGKLGRFESEDGGHTEPHRHVAVVAAGMHLPFDRGAKVLTDRRV